MTLWFRCWPALMSCNKWRKKDRTHLSKWREERGSQWWKKNERGSKFRGSIAAAAAAQQEKWKAIKIKSSYQKSWKFICKCFLSKCGSSAERSRGKRMGRGWGVDGFVFFFNFMAQVVIRDRSRLWAAVVWLQGKAYCYSPPTPFMATFCGVRVSKCATVLLHKTKAESMGRWLTNNTTRLLAVSFPRWPEESGEGAIWS